MVYGIINHLLEWFPKLPSYQAFSDRLNRLAPAFQALAEYWLSVIGVDLGEQLDYIVDSCPIILAKGPRSGHAKAYIDADWTLSLMQNHAIDCLLQAKRRSPDFWRLFLYICQFCPSAYRVLFQLA